MNHTLSLCVLTLFSYELTNISSYTYIPYGRVCHTIILLGPTCYIIYITNWILWYD